MSYFVKLYTKIFPEKLSIRFNPRTFLESISLNNKTEFLAIVGMPRSGTSIFQRVLNSLSGIYISYESIFYPMVFPYKRKEIIAYYYEILKQHNHLKSISANSLNIHPLPAYEEKYRYLGDKVIFSHKRNFKQNLIRSLKSSQVNKVIFIIRDPRERFSSLQVWKNRRDSDFKNTEMENRSSKEEHIRFESDKWNDYAAFISSLNQKFRDKTLIVRYEDFIDTSSDCLQKILLFLNMDPDAEELKFYKNNVGRKKNISPENENNDFSDRNITSYCQEFIEKFGYQKNV
jgi:hypothetical protein